MPFYMSIFCGVTTMAWQDIPFSTGVKDTLAKGDVYKESRETSVNEKAEKINDKIELADRLKNDPKYVKKTAEQLKKKEINKLIKTNSLLGRAAAILGGDYSLLTALLPENLALLLKLYETKDDLHLFRSNGKTKKYTTDQIDSYNRANALLDSVAPIPDPVDPDDPVEEPDPRINKTEDISSQVAVLTTVITTFSELNDPVSIKNAIDRIANDEVKKEVYLSIIDTLISSSDLDNLDDAVDLLGADMIIARRPNIIPDILGSFFVPLDDAIGDYPALRTKL